MAADLCAGERVPAPASPGPGTGSTTLLPLGPEQDAVDLPVAEWRGFHLALRRAALAATQNGAPLSLLMLELPGLDPTTQRLDRLAAAIGTELDHGSILRYAEHRFAVIMMDTDLGAALSRAERIGHSLSSECCGGPTCGIGVAQFRDDESLGHLIERVVEALDRASSTDGLIAVARDRVRRPRRALPGPCEQSCPYWPCAHAYPCGLT